LTAKEGRVSTKLLSLHPTRQSALYKNGEEYLPVLDYSSKTTSQPDGLSHWERIAATAQLPQNKLLKKP